jgi:mRNA interferase RelE/StbE
MSDEWDWEFTDTADRQFDGLDEYAQNRVNQAND